MYLKSLELQGFKSFPDKTKLSFGSGTTVIVGPNGSGKSNLSDAMRWVLGEMSSKSMRGSRMEDFIFAGASGRRPMGFCEVSVTFDNTGEEKLACPFDEVKVTRRYYRSGDSEYALNDRPCRLKDIYELFMDTGVGRDGYSIIGQGRIAELISKKSDERRGIFEEAAGIAKYRFRKNETERRLKNSEDNMVRIRDVFAEVEAQIGPLEKESVRAKKAIELMAAKKELDVRLWLYDTEKQRIEVETAEKNYKNSEFDLKTAEEAAEALDLQNERLLELSRTSKAAAEELLKEIREYTSVLHSLDSEYRVSETDLRHTAELLETAKASLRALTLEIGKEEEKAERLLASTEKLTEKLEAEQAAQKALEEARDRADRRAADADAALGELLELLNTAEDGIAECKVRLSILENAEKTGADRKDALLSEIAGYESSLSEREERLLSVKKKADHYTALWDQEAVAREDAEARIEDLRSERDTLEERLSDARYTAGSIEQRIRTIESMEEQFEGYAGSVRFVMRQYAEGKITLPGGRPCGMIYGPLSKIISVEDRYVTAIETALGANLGHIVTENDETAKAAMFTLKSARAGRATFFPVSSMQPYSVTPEMERASRMPGYIAVASDLVSYDKKFTNVLSNLLGRIVIFDTIDHASEMARSVRYRVKAVTLDGQVINAGGSFTGGSTKSEGTILGRAAEVRRLKEELAEKNGRVEHFRKELQEVNGAALEAQKSFSATTEKMKVLEMLKNAETRKQEQIEAEKAAEETLLSKLREDLSGIELLHTQNAEDSLSIASELKAHMKRAEEIRSMRSDKDLLRNAALEEKNRIDRSLLDATLKVRDTEHEIETAGERTADAAGRIELLSIRVSEEEARMAELSARITSIGEQQQENRKERERIHASLDRVNAEYAGNSQSSREYEAKLAEVSQKIRRKSAEKEELFRVHMHNETRLENLRAEQDKLNSQLWDEYELTRADAMALGYPPIEKGERTEAFTLRNSYRAKLRAMGSVDLDALEKYKEVKERYDKMKTQITDLEASRADLLKILDELTVDMKDEFEQSFAAINENFKRIFKELFQGGQAEIYLSEPDNPLESGIEIKAAPPGKVVKNLLQLSGGEQSFTAVALLFAILSVNPTPFCILDEIEAALDEANVVRFAQYVKKYEGTQFIIITHRRGTMEAADNLYGVTMPEQGMSEVLKLSTADIERYKEDTPA